jgi:hypothetical protein
MLMKIIQMLTEGCLDASEDYTGADCRVSRGW